MVTAAGPERPALAALLVRTVSLPGLPVALLALPVKLLLFVLCNGWNLLARALLSTAPILILDEPATGLDDAAERAFFTALNDAA